jgi:hypothetical protein
MEEYNINQTTLKILGCREGIVAVGCRREDFYRFLDGFQEFLKRIVKAVGYA